MWPSSNRLNENGIWAALMSCRVEAIWKKPIWDGSCDVRGDFNVLLRKFFAVAGIHGNDGCTHHALADLFSTETHSSVVPVHDHPVDCGVCASESNMVCAVSCPAEWAVSSA